jgi:DNA-directed RNA polymerase specialized sigma24 family protein
MITALRALPARQREALVLRYYGDLSESEVAAVMGITKGAVRIHTARALSAISAVLEAQADDLVRLDTRHKTSADSNGPEWPDPDGHRYA